MAKSPFTLEERRELVAKFNRRRIPSLEFCKRYNVNRNTLYKWKRYFSQDEKFIPLSVAPKTNELRDKFGVGLSRISSPFKVSRSDFAIDFVTGCDVAELKLVLGLIDVSK